MYNCRQIIYELQEPCVTPICALIRGFQSLPELPPVDVYVNDIMVSRNFQYKDMAQYKTSCFEVYNVKIFPTGTKDKPLADINNIKTPVGQILTFAITGSVEDINIIPIIDDINERIRPDETKIRFYNLDNSVISFEMSLPQGSISQSLSYLQSTNYNLINSGRHRFQVSSSNPNVRPIDINIDLKPGRIYTLYITGSMDPNSPGYKTGNIPQIILAVDGNTLYNKCLV